MKTHSCHQKFKVHTTDILCCRHWVLLYLPTPGHHRTFDELHKPVHLWPASHRNKVSALTRASPLSPLSLFRRIQSFWPRTVWDSGHRTSGCSYASWWLPLGMVCFLSVAANPSLGVWSICVLWGFVSLWSWLLSETRYQPWKFSQLRPMKCLSETDETLLRTEAFLIADHILEKIYAFYPCISQNVKGKKRPQVLDWWIDITSHKVHISNIWHLNTYR